MENEFPLSFNNEPAIKTLDLLWKRLDDKNLYSFLDENAASIQNFTLAKGIHWHFIQSRSPHFGIF